MSATAQIILASASPRRRELLSQVGITADVHAVDIDESQKQDEPVLDYVVRLAKEKAQRGFEVVKNPEKLPVLGSDTIVEIDGELLGKPESRQHAKEILMRLSGRKHYVHTAVAIVMGGNTLFKVNSTEVLFKTLRAQEIESYVASGEADDKAGAYGIQGLAAQFVKNINGSYSGVMGLPLFETVVLLEQCGIQPLVDVAGRH
jgi:septum formation protein